MEAFEELLRLLIGISVPTFAISSMLSMGLRTPVSTFAAQLKDRRTVLAIALANFVVIPAVGTVLVWLAGPVVDVAVQEGLIIVLCAAGAPFVLQLGAMARIPYEEIAGPMAVLLVGTVITMPIAVPVLVRGVHVDAGSIAVLLLGTMLLPMATGIALGHLVPARAGLLARVAGGIAAVSAVLMFFSGFGANRALVVDLLLSPALLLVIGVVVLAFIGGRLSGEQAGETITVTDGPAVLASQRNIAAALLVARSTGLDAMVVAVLLVSAVGFALLVPYALRTGALRRRRAGERATLWTLIGLAEAKER